MLDSYGDGWNGGTLTVDGVSYTIECAGWSGCNDAEFLVGSCGLPGCTDETACNYNADAELEDGSCTYSSETLDCEGNCISGETYTLYMFDTYGDGWSGNELYINDADGNTQTFTVLDANGEISSSWTQ